MRLIIPASLLLIFFAFNPLDLGRLSAQPIGKPGTTVATSAPEQTEGILTIVWGDPLPNHRAGGETRFTLNLPSGAKIPLDLRGLEARAFHYFGKQVIVSGRTTRDALGRSRIAVESIAAADRSEDVKTPAAVVGTKRVLFLLLKFADDTEVPHPPKFYTDMTNPSQPPSNEPLPATINGFFKKTSWHQFSWIGEVGGAGGVPATDWLTLPYPKSHYAPCGWSGVCADLQAIVDDGMAAGTAAGIDFSGYDNINFVLSNDLDCCAWGGGTTYAGKFYGATWEPPWGQETGTYSHELGHSLGLPHSGWVYYSYDSPWDVMSGRTAAKSLLCGTYFSDNAGSSSSLFCSEPGDGYIEPHKDYLGWIRPAYEIVTDTKSTVSAMIEGGALPLGTQPKMIKICVPLLPCTGNSARYISVEARIMGLDANSQFDNGIPADGVIIHEFEGDRYPIGTNDPCFFNTQSGWAVPLDAMPGDYDGPPTCTPGTRQYPNFALYNAEWSPGQTFVDSTDRVMVAVQQRSGSSFAVKASPLLMALAELPDANSNGSPDKAALVNWKGTQWIAIRDGKSGNLIRKVGIPSGYTAMNLAPLGDIDKNGFPDLVIVEKKNSDGSLRWRAIDSNSGVAISISPTAVGLNPVDLSTIDLNGDNLPDVALLATDANGGGQVQIRDAASGRLSITIKLDAGYTPIKLRTSPDRESNGSRDLAVLEYHPADGSTRVEVRDSVNGKVIQLVPFGAVFIPVGLSVFRDVKGGSAPDIAVLGRGELGNPGQLVVKNLATLGTVRSLSLGSGLEPLALDKVEDLNGDKKPELAILRRYLAYGSVAVTVYDVASGKVFQQIAFSNTASAVPVTLGVSGDNSGNGLPDLDVLELRSTDIRPRVETKDAASGKAISTTYFP